VRGVAEFLPFPNTTFDFLSIGYALRRVASVEATFAECHRVLRPGGRLVALEFTRPLTWAGYPGTRLYFHRFRPWAARRGAGCEGAERLMRYFWAEDRAGGVPPETVHAVATAAASRPGLAGHPRRVRGGQAPRARPVTR
jgi:demethylmenaquinone methyltransferase/2-methoxy-6-polyprenyl-1,4-benzoquinol methylase